MQAKVLRCELKVEGMFCSSCELRIEQALYKLDGIINVEASYSGSVVRIAYDQDVIQLPEIVAAIEAEDYRVKPIPGHTGIKIDMERRIGEEPTSVNQVLGIIIILFALYLIVRNTIGFNFIPQVDQSMGYGILFLVGVLTSLHCISMCGGINLSQCVGHDFSGDEDNKLARLKPSFMYNLGRVISYTIIGGIVGALGSAVSFSGTAKGVVALVAGAFMIIMGINMLNLFPGLRKFNPRLPRFFGNKTNSHNGRRKPLYVGLLNGLMPCGPLQAMQIYALAAGSFMAGAVSMLAFSLGTVPLMFGFGAISSLLSARFTKQ
ncbi:MAG TPA: sulfite exporter TauE/SafE family protein, partial [Syntrophomonadaceae bacterium]|nr:sulfite exporter TauE/SafE family protein [Syntrophomonadaceae bacterium]